MTKQPAGRLAPWFTFWPHHWLTDERLSGQPIEVFGALAMLRARAWIADPPCTLPADDKQLGEMSGLRRRWKKYSGVLLRFFDRKNDRLADPYLESLYAEMQEKHLRKVMAGQLGAAKRYGRPSSACADGNSEKLSTTASGLAVLSQEEEDADEEQ